MSFREEQPSDSLHISVHGNRLAAHVDRVSPLAPGDRRAARYSLRRAVAHNVSGMTHDLVRLLRGRQGDHRCQLSCEWLSDPAESEPQEQDLLDPRASLWGVHLEVRVTGHLDEERLRNALTAVFGDSTPREVLAAVDCADDASLDAARERLQAEVVWPSQQPPLRAELVRHPGGDRLVLNVNHAAADATAALRVLQSVAGAYARGDQPGGKLEVLAARALPVRPASAPVPPPVQAYKNAVEWLRDRLARPARLAPDGAQPRVGHGFHLVRLSPAETADVIDRQHPGTSRNRLMGALHLAIGDWNLEHGAPGRRIGVLVPVNLRPAHWPEATIGNFSLTARVSTSRRHRSGPVAVRKAVTAQTTRNKRSRTGVALLAALQRAGLVPLWAKQSLVVLQPLTGNRLVDTALLAHLGWLDDPPDFGPGAGRADEVWFSVPARTPNALCLGAATVGGRLHLTFRYPPDLLGPEAVRRFADHYLANLRRVSAA